MINVLLVGFGKMGKIIKEHLDYIGAQAVLIHDPHYEEYNTPLSKLDLSNIQVAIEFTHPDEAYQNVKTLLSKKIPVVAGTTGWFHRIDELKHKFSPEEHTLIYGANFSIGMNLLYELVEDSVKLIDQTKLYDVYGIEAHHRRKADTPSGTAKILSEIILENTHNKDHVVFNLDNKPLVDNAFSFSSIRAGNIVGYHEIGFDSEFDEIKIVHNAKNRGGFAMGAILAAKYAVENKGYHNFKEIFRELIAMHLEEGK
jgi:4-hydroxy-tetrahydrodipicolinate reductase